jgi:hypothetical protein
MIYSIFANRDATIYERQYTMNTGIDPLLELSHETPGSGSSIYNSRILLKFDVSDIESRVNSGKISQNAKYYLALVTADIREIPQEYKIYAYPLSSSWTNGTGKFVNLPYTTDGVSWRYRTSKRTGTEWDIPPGVTSYEWDNISQTWVDAAILFGTNYMSATVTSSYFTHEGGGTWWDYDNLECTQSFSFQSTDLYMDVTNIVKKWITGSGRFENDGMILKFSNEMESSPDNLVNSLKFFGTDSNTIYVPRLNVVWDDSEFITGSLTPATEDNLNLNVKLKKFYAEKEKAKIRIYAYSRYPQKNYTTTAYQTVNHYLPSSSYYEIRDAHSDEIILPFDENGTKISCDGTSSYFNLWMDSFQPERFYRVVVKVERDGGDNVQIFDNNHYFKVTR